MSNLSQPAFIELMLKSAVKATIEEFNKEIMQQLEQNQLYVNKEMQKMSGTQIL